MNDEPITDSTDEPLICEAWVEGRGDDAGHRCTRVARHWSHVYLGDRRMPLCFQHSKMIERRRAKGHSGNGLLMLWASMTASAPDHQPA